MASGDAFEDAPLRNWLVDRFRSVAARTGNGAPLAGEAVHKRTTPGGSSFGYPSALLSASFRPGPTTKSRLTYASLGVFGEEKDWAKRRTFAHLVGEPCFRHVDVEQILKGNEIGYLIVPLQAGYDIHDVLTRLPDACLELLRQGRTGLIVDHSREATRFLEQRPRDWHLALNALDLPANRVCFLTQNKKILEQYCAWACAHDLAPRINIANYDYYVKHFSVDARRDFSSGQEYAKATVDKFKARKNIEYEYLSLNYKPRPWRIALLTRLIMDDLWDDGLISFGGITEGHKTATERSVINKDGPLALFHKLGIASETDAFLPELTEKGQIFFSKDNPHESASAQRTGNPIGQVFYRSGFSLVTETEMFPHELRITEKPFKAFANYHPAIVFGNQWALRQIREYGFETFDRWIDESYDVIPSAGLRFKAAYNAFLEFRRQSSRLIMEDANLREVLAYNVDHSAVGLDRLFREEIDPWLARQFLTAMPLPDSAG